MLCSYKVVIGRDAGGGIGEDDEDDVTAEGSMIQRVMGKQEGSMCNNNVLLIVFPFSNLTLLQYF